MNFKRKFTFVLSIGCLLSVMSYGAEYFVSPNGIDKTDDADWGKTEGTAYLSIQAAVDSAAVASFLNELERTPNMFSRKGIMQNEPSFK